MLENVTKVIARFFGIIAGSLSGISAILIAIGYLAERSHLKMLGFTSIPVDLNQYLYTGANLVGFLPGIIILRSIYLLLDPLPLIILFLIIFMWFSMRFHWFRLLWDKTLNHTKKWIVEFKLYLFIFFVFIQVVSLNWMVKAVLLENLLFTEEISTTPPEFSFLKADTNNLQQLLISKDKNEKLSTYFTQLFLNVLLTGLVLYYLMTHDKKSQQDRSFHMKFWMTINLLLLATQIILIPGNYGVLLLNNKYQEVKVQFKANDQVVPVHDDEKPLKLKNLPPKLVNTIRDQILEVEGIQFKYDLEASPEVFTDPDGDVLTYSATSDKPNIVRIEIDKNFLSVSPLQKGQAIIMVEAVDSEGMKASTSFNINVEDDIVQWGAEVANPISQKTLFLGETPFIRDLMAEPSVFRLKDTEPGHLTFQARSSMTNVAMVDITGNKLTVQPISRGITAITITANDGYGGHVTSEFNLIVLEQKLKWPVDNGLLLLYQSNDVFFLYSKLEKRIWYVRSEDIESMVYYGLDEVF